MQIVHISAECYPLAKVGGLADVVGALPKYQKQHGTNASVIMPFYATKFVQSNAFNKLTEFQLTIHGTTHTVSVLQLNDNEMVQDIFVIKIPKLLDRKSVYGYQDDVERFMAFQNAVLTWINSWEERPDIIHCHDHHTGLIPFMITQCPIYKKLKEIPTVFSIHNAQYQGHFSFDQLGLLPDFDQKYRGLLDWGGDINPMAAAIKCAWKVTTVSTSYLEELQEKANGLENLLAHEKAKSSGILNGIDPEIWNPATDPMLLTNYTKSAYIKGKKANKEWICSEYKLDSNRPLFAFIGRFVYEKAADLLAEVVETILKDNKEISIMILGSGNEAIESELQQLKKKYKGNFNTHIGYDEKLSHIIYAGADFLLMPSRVEPCGLNQMYALRYGTIPIVRETGGLKDTVIDIGDDGVGISHRHASVADICYSINRAYILYQELPTYRKVQKKAMLLDHSWNASAEKYNNLYKSIIYQDLKT